jgi:hypothetical protein
LVYSFVNCRAREEEIVALVEDCLVARLVHLVPKGRTFNMNSNTCANRPFHLGASCTCQLARSCHLFWHRRCKRSSSPLGPKPRSNCLSEPGKMFSDGHHYYPLAQTNKAQPACRHPLGLTAQRHPPKSEASDGTFTVVASMNGGTNAGYSGIFVIINLCNANYDQRARHIHGSRSYCCP